MVLGLSLSLSLFRLDIFFSACLLASSVDAFLSLFPRFDSASFSRPLSPFFLNDIRVCSLSLSLVPLSWVLCSPSRLDSCSAFLLQPPSPPLFIPHYYHHHHHLSLFLPHHPTLPHFHSSLDLGPHLFRTPHSFSKDSLLSFLVSRFSSLVSHSYPHDLPFLSSPLCPSPCLSSIPFSRLYILIVPFLGFSSSLVFFLICRFCLPTPVSPSPLFSSVLTVCYDL